MYSKRVKRDIIHATKPNSDVPLKAREISEKEKAEIEMCLNCDKPQCKWGTCKKFRGAK